MNNTDYQIKTVSAAVKSVLSEKGVALTEGLPAGAEPLIVFWAGDARAREEARRLQERYGGEVLGVDASVPYPAHEKARAARMRWEAAYGMTCPLAASANMEDALGAADSVMIVASLWGSHLAAPLAAFLARHDFAGKALGVAVLASEGEAAPAVYRELLAPLAHGAQIGIVECASAKRFALVAGRFADGFEKARAVAREIMEHRVTRAA